MSEKGDSKMLERVLLLVNDLMKKRGNIKQEEYDETILACKRKEVSIRYNKKYVGRNAWMAVDDQEDDDGTGEEDEKLSMEEQLNKAGNLLCDRLKEFHEMSTNDKLKSLEDMAEHVRTSKGEKPKFFQVLEEYRSSKGQLYKAIYDEVKLDTSCRWMANYLRCEKGWLYTAYVGKLWSEVGGIGIIRWFSLICGSSNGSG